MYSLFMLDIKFDKNWKMFVARQFVKQMQKLIYSFSLKSSRQRESKRVTEKIEQVPVTTRYQRSDIID